MALVKDRHRCVRTVTLRAVGAVASGEPGSPALPLLTEAARKDRAYACRSAAVEGIGRFIAGLRQGDRGLLGPLLDAGRPGIDSRTAGGAIPPGRSIDRDPSMN